MKHGTITLQKFKSLATKLDLPLWQTVGLLESLWLFTMHNARNGDLSRFSPEEIAEWLEYEGSAAELIQALVQTKWLDRDGSDIVIHDWKDHKPTWLKGVEARQLNNSQLSSELSSELSPTPSATKCATKQVGLGMVGLGTGIGSGNSSASAKTKRQFTKPTVDQVAAYCRERENTIVAADFIDHYETVGWLVGTNQTPMRDWKAAVRTWESKRKQEQPKSRVATPEDVAGIDLMTGRPL